MVDQESVRIRKLREALDLTKDGFARQLGDSFTTVSRWENGHGKPSRLAQRLLQEVAEGLRKRSTDGLSRSHS